MESTSEIRSRPWLPILGVAAIQVVWFDYLADSSAGLALSLLFSFLPVALSCTGLHKTAVTYAFCLLAASPIAPRDLIDQAAVDGWRGAIVFHSPANDVLGGIAVGQLSLLATILIYLANAARKSVLSRSQAASLSKFSLVILATFAVSVIGLLNNELISGRFALRDVRLFLSFVLGGAFLASLASAEGKSSAQDWLNTTIGLAGLMMTIRASMFFFKDLFTGNSGFDFFNNVYISVPWAIAFLVTEFRNLEAHNKALFILVCLTGLIPVGRAQVILMPLMLIAGSFTYVRYLSKLNRAAALKRIFTSIIAVSVAGGVISIIAGDRFTEFIAYKVASTFSLGGADIFNLAKSVGVRLLEVGNIWLYGLDHPLTLAIGNGLGAGYRLDQLPMPFLLDNADYSEEEISSGVFFRAHTFLAYWLIRFGLLGLLLLLATARYVYTRGATLTSNSQSGNTVAIGMFATTFSIPFITEMYWLPALPYLAGFLLIALNDERTELHHEHACNLNCYSR